MKHLLFTLFMLAVIVILSLAAISCSAPLARAGQALAATGDAAQQATAFVQASESAVQSARQHADAAGQALLGQASSAHQRALGEIGQVQSGLVTIQAQVKAEASALAAETAKYNAVYHSFGYQAQLIVVRFAILLAVLAGLHILFLALQFVLPVPYGAIAGILAKIVNPLGWAVAIAGYFEKRALANALTAAANVGKVAIPAAVSLVHA